MTDPILPGHTQWVIDKGFLFTTPWRRWANDLTKSVIELKAAAGLGPTAPADPLAFIITGNGWIDVTGSLESGNFTVTQRPDLTTDDLPEGADNLYFPEAPEDGTTYGRKDADWVAISTSGVTDGDKGDVTVSASGATWTIDAGVVTYAKLQDVSATQRVLGRNTASAGDAEEVTLSQLLDWVGSAANGDILYRSGGAWTRLAAGTNGHALILTAGLPAWSAITFTPSIQTVTSSATVTPAATDDKVVISAQAAGLTLANPSGTAAEGQGFVIALKDNGTARSITFGSDYRAMGAALPTTTTAGKWMYIPVERNHTDSKWDVFVASVQQ